MCKEAAVGGASLDSALKSAAEGEGGVMVTAGGTGAGAGGSGSTWAEPEGVGKKAKGV